MKKNELAQTSLKLVNII